MSEAIAATVATKEAAATVASSAIKTGAEFEGPTTVMNATRFIKVGVGLGQKRVTIR